MKVQVAILAQKTGGMNFAQQVFNFENVKLESELNMQGTLVNDTTLLINMRIIHECETCNCNGLCQHCCPEESQ